MVKNKKILCLLIFLILFIGSCGFIYVHGRKELPRLTVTYNGKKLQVGQGPYTWKSRGKLKHYTLESYTPVLVKLLPGIKVSPNGQLRLSFDYQPKTITLCGGNKSDGKMIKNNIINISDYNTGLYILNCTWKEGSAVYMIYVNIHG